WVLHPRAHAKTNTRVSAAPARGRDLIASRPSGLPLGLSGGRLAPRSRRRASLTGHHGGDVGGSQRPGVLTDPIAAPWDTNPSAAYRGPSRCARQAPGRPITGRRG